MLNHEKVVEEAGAFTRILIRVPEAYLIVTRFRSTRPGFLVLDPDGRRVDSISLLEKNLTGKKVAAWLQRARKAPARERFVVRLSPAAEQTSPSANDRRDAFLRELKAWPEVDAAGTSRRGDTLTISVVPGSLPPDRVLSRAGIHGLDAVLLDPVQVELTVTGNTANPAEPSPDSVPSAIPGAWYVSGKGPIRAHVPCLLLDPRLFAAGARGYTPDITAYEFSFTRISKGGRGFAVAAAPLKVPGVLSVFPDIFGERERVVVRKGATTPEAILESIKGAGGEAKPAR